MALLLYWLDKDTNAVASVTFDIVSNETHDSALNITSHPVEDGVDVTDHARSDPKTLNIEGYVSNKPILSNLFNNPLLSDTVWNSMAYTLVDLDLDGGATQADLPASTSGAPIFTPGGLTSAIKGAISSLLFGKPANPKAAVLKFVGDPPDRAKDVFDKLSAAQDSKQLITAVTKFGTIVSLLIAKLTLPRQTEDGDGAHFQVTLHQIRVVQSETVDAPKAAEARGAPGQAKGSQAAKAESTAAGKGESFLSVITDGVGLGGFLPKVPGT